MEKIYNKLVRDNIPEKIKNNNELPITRILNEDEYRVELYKKLIEECMEVAKSNTKEEIIEELSDVLEVLKSIGELENVDLNKIIESANKKRNKRGGFQKRIFLEKVISKK